MKTLGMRILGTGEALPARCVGTGEVAELCGMEAKAAVKRSGVLTRHWIGPDEDPLQLGAAAAREALAAASLSIDDVDVILGASGTPMQAIPDGAALLAAELGLQGGFSYSLHGTC